MICRNCGKMVLPNDGHIIECEFYCNDCTVQCADCGNYILKDDAIETYDGDFICKYCRDNDYYTCEHCGEIFHSDDMVYIEDKEMYVCESCADSHYYKCECCNKYFSDRAVYQTYDDNWVCQHCYDDDYRTCEDCGRAVHYDDAYYNERDEVDYCPNCEGKHKRNYSIYGYHDYEDFCKRQVYGETGIKEFFGLEIEVSGNQDYADEFLDIVSDVVLMRDGSIDEGFEIVTEPMTRKYIEENFISNFAEGMKFLNDVGFRGHNKGGIHIHVSQEVFTKEMLCVVRNVLYSGNDEDFEVWKAITQRKQSEIDHWCRYSDAKDCSSILGADEDYPSIASGRYTALNYDNRTGTYEFRIFNSNTRIERIKKNIQTVYSLIDYANYKASRYYLANTINYIEFVKENNEFYPDLYAFLYEMGIVQRIEEERMAA